MIGLNFTHPIVFEPLFMERCCQLQHSGGSIVTKNFVSI